jgi:hypothetical protein
MQQLNRNGHRLLDIHFSEGICEGCILGKHPQEKFEKRKACMASSPLELVHSDIMGPFPHSSISKARYDLTFIDDYSRFTWVYFLKKKFKVFEHLRDLNAHAETRSKRKIKALYTNNVGEYVNRDALYTNNVGEYVNRDAWHLCLEARIQLQHTIHSAAEWGS